MIRSVWQFIIGKPLHTELEEEEKLNKFLALPIFASDALSSVAYGTEEILLALVLAGTASMTFVFHISIAIAILLIIIIISYRQIITAYPGGGGAYVVARENLGMIPSQVTGASLLIDYVLTVAVSVSAGIAAIVSAFPVLAPYNVWICVGSIMMITLANLRGTKESGLMFAFPVYLFIISLLSMVAIGIFKYFTVGITYVPVHHEIMEPLQPLTIFLVLKAFSSGCAAVTGIEAISDGVTAFKKPVSKNANTTMIWLAVFLASMFLGVSFLTKVVGIVPIHGGETVLSQLTSVVYGRNFFYYMLQVLTTTILILAANTSFAGFPRLAALQAEDGFLPRQLKNVGDRLVFSNGILILSFFSILLVIMFQGSTHLLIPLYAIGVFLSFTLAQFGMVKRWWKIRTTGWKRNMTINAFGALVTFVVLCVIAVTKFMSGAWVVIIMIPLLIAIFLKTKHHYNSVDKQISLAGYVPPAKHKHTVVVLIPGVHKGILPALEYAKAISADNRALYIESYEAKTEKIKKNWEEWEKDIPLVILESPYRSLVQPVIDYLKEVKFERPGCMVTVIIPEFVAKHWWEKLLHNQAGWMLKIALMFQKNIVVTNVRYHLE